MKYWESMQIIFRALQESGISQNLPLFIRKFKIQTFFRFQKKTETKIRYTRIHRKTTHQYTQKTEIHRIHMQINKQLRVYR